MGIEITPEMVKEFRRVALADGKGIESGLAAALAVVERDHDVRPKPVVHVGVKGDMHVHCCGMDVFDLPNEDDLTLDPHGVTCKGPT